MNLGLDNRFFIVCGAGSGFGRAVAEALLMEGAHVLAVARTESVLLDFQSKWTEKLEVLAGDITQSEIQQKVFDAIQDRYLSGVLVNAGGPPAKNLDELMASDWDEAYRQLVRWKIQFVQGILPIFHRQSYGRLLFIESISVKQPVENLILSNTFRPAIVGFMKTLSQDFASQNITMNILAPGYHDTAAMQRLFKKKAEMDKGTEEAARKVFEDSIPVKRLGKADEMASLAAWLLSEKSGFVTGQTISHDGGGVRGIFG